jgi:hypothetical protein
MNNAWKVLWFEKGHRYFKSFEGEKPSQTEAPSFIIKLKERGIVDVYLVSKRKAFPPPASVPRVDGTLWCPYCVKYRKFHVVALKIPGTGVVGPDLKRCTICTISVENFWVRKFNSSHLFAEETMIAVKRQVRKKRA